MRIVDDLFPALAFFIVYKLWGLYWGTFTLIVASAIQILYMQLRYKKVERIYWISFWVILIFGGATIFFRDPAFLQWKVTLINWIMGGAFLLSHFFHRTLLECFVKQPEQERFPPGALRKLNCMWGVYLVILGTLNLYVARHYSLNTWVNFKVFGLIALTVLFVVLQSAYLFHLIKKSKEK